jgi:fructose-1-phosphate kinase PfkB-like protein
VRTILDTRDEALREAVEGGWRPWLLKPNADELASVRGGDPLAAARSLREAAGAEAVLATLGGGGALLVTAEGAWRASAPPVEVLNTVGAGDACAGAAAIFADASPPELLRHAVAAGSASVTVDAPGAVPQEVFRRLLREIKIRPG